MNKRRLLKLADLLDEDAKNKNGVKFDLMSWGFTYDDEEVSASCGTVACAMGLAVLSGAFKRAGLTNGSISPRSIEPQFEGRFGFGAAAALFDISRDDARYLFADWNYPAEFRNGAKGERFVAKRIRDFAAGKVAAG